MKTDLDLHPMYLKSDEACLAHLHLGIPAYWVVTSFRYQLRQKSFNKTWSQILEIMLTKKSVTSEAKNLQDKPYILTMLGSYCRSQRDLRKGQRHYLWLVSVFSCFFLLYFRTELVILCSRTSFFS